MTIEGNWIGGGTVAVPCRLSGEETSCELDTGATSADVSISNLGVKVLRKTGIRGASGHVEECDEVEIKDAMLGAFPVPSLKGTRCPGAFSRNALGVDVFRGQSVRFDFVGKRIRIGERAGSASGFLEFSDAGHWLIPVRVGNRKILALWDTGAGTSIIDQRLVNELPELFKKELDVVSEDAAGARRKLPVYTGTAISIGNVEITNTRFLVRDFFNTRQNVRPDVEMILGVNVLKNCRWTFDLPRKEWGIRESGAGD